MTFLALKDGALPSSHKVLGSHKAEHEPRTGKTQVLDKRTTQKPRLTKRVRVRVTGTFVTSTSTGDTKSGRLRLIGLKIN